MMSAVKIFSLISNTSHPRADELPEIQVCKYGNFTCDKAMWCICGTVDSLSSHKMR